jgi:hypothetical protein
VIKIVDRDQIAGIQLAIDMHKSGKSIAWIRNRMKRVLKDERNKPLPASFFPEKFAAFGYDHRKKEKTEQWKSLHRKPNAKADAALEQRYVRLEHHFLDKWKDDSPESAAREDGFPAGWTKHIGGDDEFYDIYIDRYTRLGVTVWKDRGDFWWWKPREETEARQTLSKQDAIDAAENWIGEHR